MTLDPTRIPASGDSDVGGVSGDQALEVYWRPGCPYCMSLRRTLKRHGVAATWHNIWDDDEARRFVARANGGNETVPTVRVGTTTLTNPKWSDLSAALGDVPGNGIEPAQSESNPPTRDRPNGDRHGWLRRRGFRWWPRTPSP